MCSNLRIAGIIHKLQTLFVKKRLYYLCMIKNSVLTGFDFGHVQPSTSLLVKTVDTQSKSGSQKQKKICTFIQVHRQICAQQN